MALTVPQKVRNLYQRFDKKILKTMPDVYSDDIQFRDPLHALNGLSNLTEYLSGMMDDLLECRFEFHHSMELPERGEALLFWTMHYRHKKLAGGKQLELTGNTHLLFKDKVYYHRDYFDAGSLLYEHLPVMGFAIRQIKKKVGAK
ncbi:nuclear transport factor 2 family protein [Cellvibrio sp. pealriver]|uniref:nuclear transport factor 2 family protein n=1 Tax=Cellvibrio sp. pealriver TaxID=1622269 RepID=UPI00066FDC48|nr:nuclear transport factor 2 family protein [Cellvibrio sp. pealriver]